MKVLSIVVLLVCYYCSLVRGTSSSSSTEPQNDFKVGNLLPKSLLESIQQQREGRILNGLQYVQHSPGAHSVQYLPAGARNENLNGAYSTDFTSQQVDQQNIVDLQVPTSADSNKILLRLPSQPLPVQNSYGSLSPSPPPRRHYRITLVRNRKPSTPPPQTQSSEVEEKTLIYVLVKKPDESAAAAQLQELQNSEQNNIKHHAPEVYFIKYKENNNASKLPSSSSSAASSSYLPSLNGQTLKS